MRLKMCLKKQHGRRGRRFIGLLMICCLVFLTACATSNQEEMNRPVKTETKKAGKKKSSGGKNVEPLADENPIPADGIITKERFETVVGENREIRFVGKTEDGISYTWIYDCSQIQNPEDQNLRITFDSKNLDDIKKKANQANDALKMTMYGKGLICSPTLEVELPEAWQSDKGMLLKEQNSKLAKVSDVSIFTDPKEEDSSKDKKKDKDKKDAGAEKTTEAKVTIESLKAPKPGITVLTMHVLSLEGDSYIVGGITDEDKLAEINQQIKNIANANANGNNPANTANGSNDLSGSDATNGAGNDQAADIPNDITNSGGSGGGNDSSGGGGGNGSGGSGGSSGGTCTISINCSTILNNMDNLTSGKEEFVPSNGWILKPVSVSFSPGESVHDVLKRVCKDRGIHMESSYSPVYDSAYVEGINQLYEFDCGELSGWMFNVNGWFPNYGCSKYTVSDGDEINWVYTCDLGKDVGDNSMY